MIVPETTTTGRWGEGFIFRLANLPSDPCGASLGGYTFTLIRLVRHEHARVSEIGGIVNDELLTSRQRVGTIPWYRSPPPCGVEQRPNLTKPMHS